ncbi:MAG: ribosome biogenesis GTPase Der [Candidatus Doudnabacteria bacterium]|nr:ribosome biogenesis GTPase Der [Candidatus Doudnabacteria bacterium]
MRIPLVAIVGLPNSGKSTLFNKILERRTALTYPTAGTTRDRAYGLTNWNSMPFYIIDTAGIVNRPDSELEKNVQKQTQIAADEADIILLVVDGKTPPTTEDLRIASQLNKTGKKVILAANKIDSRNVRTDIAAQSYEKLGLGNPYAISAANGIGTGDLLDAIVLKLKEDFGNLEHEEHEGVKIAFIGKPNVGKSSLINALLKQERLLVHDKAGTTRSVVEIPFEDNGNKFVLLDTAGIKKKWQQDSDVEAAAAFQSIRTITQTDVIFFVLDGEAEITVQDQAIAADILDAGKPVVLLLNKIDKLSKEQQDQFLEILPNYLPQMWYIPVLFTSAKTAQGMDLLLKFALDVLSTSDKQIDQEMLTEFLQKTLEENKPGKMDDEREPKFYGFKQIGIRPPAFRMVVNFPSAIADSWKKWFEKQFRLKFGFEGTPVFIRFIRKQ